MAKLAEIAQLNHNLSVLKEQLARQEGRLLALKGSSFQGAKPIGYDSIVESIIRLLKEIAKINNDISIKYLSLAVEAANSFEENEILATASQYAKHANEAEVRIKYYEASLS